MKFLEAILTLSFLFFGFYEAFSLSRKLACRQDSWRREFINITTEKLDSPLPIPKSSCGGRLSFVLKGDL